MVYMTMSSFVKMGNTKIAWLSIHLPPHIGDNGYHFAYENVSDSLLPLDELLQSAI